MERDPNKKTVFITGATGYIGTRLIKRLIKKGYPVLALVRKGSEQKVPAGAQIIIGNPFDARTFQSYIPAGCVFVQLLGVAHPSPKKAQQFKDIDLRSVKASADAASAAGINHFIYMSVAMAPVKLMQAYQEVRKEGERYCLTKTFNCSFIRPWYVIGPGHWWPVLLLPVYGLAELVPSWRKKTRAIGLVTIKQILHTLVNTIDQEPLPQRILEIKEIRSRR
ncbi:MAG: NAD(P)H-binding protein [Bacteroidota bacterium]|nr:NAD(P)H-binding protein [Bacteroidota bacterium]